MTDDIDRTDEYRETFGEIDGAELLDDLHDTATGYVAFPDDHAAAAVTLWISTTHVLPAFEFAPRLAITSPEKRCGKTRLLDIIGGACHRPLATADATVAAIFRSLGGDHPPTLIIDEVDAQAFAISTSDSTSATGDASTPPHRSCSFMPITPSSASCAT